ncbi:MAG: flagellar basal body-associated protein FliL [Gammaproteobacteria bacterium]|nr:flagellar basal body-associated protein FliL [Gammaproteobacteria bacterium]
MAEENLELELDDGKAKKKKLIIIIAVVVAVLALGGGGAFFFLAGDDPAAVAEGEVAVDGESAAVPEATGPQAGAAIYVAMPRPFIFNVPGSRRERLVQIKVQLLVRGAANDTLARKHIPLIESTLLGVFARTSADVLATIEGKENLRMEALVGVREGLKKLEGKDVVEEVLFTGFVMQ